MKALCYNGRNDLRVERVPDPEIVNPQDIILRVIMSSVCGSISTSLMAISQRLNKVIFLVMSLWVKLLK
jgi:hypothetical protein